MNHEWSLDPGWNVRERRAERRVFRNGQLVGTFVAAVHESGREEPSKAALRDLLEAANSGSTSNSRSPDDVVVLECPSGLHKDTFGLVVAFTQALADKLRAAEIKYGFSNGWQDPGCVAEVREQLLQHIEKGDPRDVGAYCAFLWFHAARTTSHD